MRHVEVVRRDVLEPETILTRILDERYLKAFHGPTTHISPWVGHCRTLSFYVDSSDAPLRLLGASVKAAVVQTYTGDAISNCFTILNMLTIRSSWRIENSCVVIRADIDVHLPFPLSWIAENFVATRAEAQLNAYVTFVHSKFLRDNQ